MPTTRSARKAINSRKFGFFVGICFSWNTLFVVLLVLILNFCVLVEETEPIGEIVTDTGHFIHNVAEIVNNPQSGELKAEFVSIIIYPMDNIIF